MEYLAYNLHDCFASSERNGSGVKKEARLVRVYIALKFRHVGTTFSLSVHVGYLGRHLMFHLRPGHGGWQARCD